ncbi:MAG: glycosyltransferase family 9 protein [Syntrophales bacterium]|nr:glycosyltransferase family 9 protein [Syntrophales bacterium]
MFVETQFAPFKDIHKILVIQLGDIGDVIWTIPTLLSIVAAYPYARLSVLVREPCGEILRSEPYLNNVFEVSRPQGGLAQKVRQQIDLIRAIRGEGVDMAIDLRTGDRGAVMARLSGARVRAALMIRDASFLRNRMFTHLVVPTNENIRMSYGAADQSLRIVRGLGIATKTDVPVVHVADHARDSVCRLLKSAGIDMSKAMVTINPFSRWSYKEWAPDKWVKIIDWLSDTFNLGVIVVGSSSERERASVLLKACSGGIFNAAGETSLAELAALLSMSRLHIGVDSAAPHIAAAVGTPTVTIYGPSDWRDWAPVGEKHLVVVSEMACIPCHQKGCNDKGQGLCLDALSVDAVKNSIMSAVLPLQSA